MLEKGWRTASGIATLAFLLGTVTTEIIASRRAKTAKLALESQRAEYLVTSFAAFGPLSNHMSLMAAAQTSRRRELAGPSLYAAAVAARSLVPVDGVRAALFYRTVEDGKDVFLPHPVYWVGRGDRAQSRFVRGEGEGIDVWNAADQGSQSFYPDIADERPPNMDMNRPRTYAGFATVPILAGDECVGLATINTLEPNQLTSEDVGTLWVIAALSGAILGMVGCKWPGV